MPSRRVRRSSPGRPEMASVRGCRPPPLIIRAAVARYPIGGDRVALGRTVGIGGMNDPGRDSRGKLSVAFGDDEGVHVMVETPDAVLALTDDRVVGRDGLRTVLDVPVTEIRRIQLDVEKGREATLAVVPEEPAKGVLAMSVPSGQLASVAEIVTRIGALLEKS